MIIHKSFILASLFLTTLSLHSAEGTLSIGERLREAAQQKATAEIQVYTDKITELEQEIVTRQKEVENNGVQFQQLKAQHDAAVAALVAKFKQDTQAIRDEDVRLKSLIQSLGNAKIAEEQEKMTIETQIADFFARLKTDKIKRKNKQKIDEAGYQVIDEDDAPLNKLNKKDTQVLPEIRKPAWLMIELWDILPDEWKNKIGTQHTT